MGAPIGNKNTLGKRWKVKDTTKLSMSHIGLNTWSRGRKFSEEHKRKLKENNPKYWLGKKRSSETRLKISESRKGVTAFEKHHNWKGQDVSYRNLHRWVERKIGRPSECVYCGKVGFGHQMHWANLSGEYKRDLSDWIRLCVKCHKAYDRKLLILNQ